MKKRCERAWETLGLSDEELAFYDALETNDSAVKVLGEPTLKAIARELVEIVKKNVAIDWTVRENVRANLRVLVKRILRKYDYPPDKQEQATRTVLEQAAVLSAAWAVVEGLRPRAIRIVRPRPQDRYVTCVPLVPLQAAAGAFSDPQVVEDDNWEWIEIETKHRLRRGMFVAQVVGRSMEPAIPDGSYCLFASPVAGSRQGRTVLVQLRDSKDPETGERYTVKRYQSEKIQAPDETWLHSKITLHPNNPVFEPIVLTSDNEGSAQVVAEVIEVLELRDGENSVSDTYVPNSNKGL